MKHILIRGDWQPCAELIQLLQRAGDLVSLTPDSETVSADFMLIRVADAAHLPVSGEEKLPWAAWVCSQSKTLIPLAYQAGAQAVFPENTPVRVICDFIQRALAVHTSETPAEPLEKAIQRHYQKGDTILLGADSVLEVKEGIIAQTMVHQDGAEVLLGLFGPHMLVVPHPEDTCYIQLMAQTNANVVIQPWPTAVLDPLFLEKLRARLQQMEAWAAMQARPHLDQRVLGILSLLAEQFGRECGSGESLTVRITHMQLASAVGATRTTITRTLGELKAQGRLTMLQTDDGERFCLPKWEHGSHGLHRDN
jgi:CRP-like cAMP-binding protein